MSKDKLPNIGSIVDVDINVRYQIAVGKDQGTISGDGWSGYYKRLSRSDRNGRLPDGSEVYGLEQARQHIAELRATTGEYRSYWRKVKLSIQRVTTKTETIEVG